MFKIALIGSVLVLNAASALAETKIEMPLTAESPGDKVVLLASLNTRLKAKGLPEFPKTVALGKNDQPLAQQLIEQVNVADKALNIRLSIFRDGYGYYFHEIPKGTCYRGKASDVPAIIKGLMGLVIQEDQGLQALRYGKVKKIYPMFKNDFFETNAEVRESDEENNPREVKMWDEYNTQSTTVLILSDLGPQGDGIELYATEIKQCK